MDKDDDTEVLDRGDEIEVEVEIKSDEPEVKADKAEVGEQLELDLEAKDDEPEERSRDEKGKFIPKDRFDEAVQKERAEKEVLAGRVKAYEARDAQSRLADDFGAAEARVRELIKEHASQLSDGEVDKAAALMEEILNLRDAVAERKAESKAAGVKESVREEVRYDALVAKMEVDHPQIDPDSDQFDKDAVADVQALMAGYMQTQKLTSTQALQRAVARVFPAKASVADAKAADKGAEVGMRRKEEAVKKAIDAKNKQPASTGSVGKDHDKEGGPLDAAAVMKMSWDEFVALPESKLSEMRGDFVS